MAASQGQHANKVLVHSIYLSSLYMVLAFSVGFATSSQVIFIDAIDTLISIVLSCLSLASLRFIDKKDFKNYPFGKEAFEPFTALSQYGILIVFSVTYVVNAVLVILSGGKKVDLATGVLYGLVSTLFCHLSHLYLKRLAKRSPTPVEDVELEQWKYSYQLSFAMFVGFGVAWLFAKTPAAPYIPFVDPVLAILLTVGFIKTAILGVRHCVKELLSATPSPELASLIRSKVEQTSLAYPFSDMVLRLAKVGRQLIIEVDYVIEEGTRMDSIRMQDRLRGQLDAALRELPFEKWLNVNFVGDRKWAE